MSRLAQQYGHLERALAAQSDVEKRAAVKRLVAAALVANGMTPAVAAAPGLVERLDEHAWDVQEVVERGNAMQTQYEAAFRRARAASAAQLLADPDCALEDVVYEAVHGLPAEVEALAILTG